ncbi:desulfoferrodoxin family protein [Caminibacter sp.]
MSEKVETKYRPLIQNRTKMKMKNPKNPTKGELKHTPKIVIGPTNKNGYTLVEIIVGQQNIIHPSKKTHWIDFIELYADGKLVARTLFEPGMAMGYVAYKVILKSVK